MSDDDFSHFFDNTSVRKFDNSKFYGLRAYFQKFLIPNWYEIFTNSTFVTEKLEIIINKLIVLIVF